MTNKTTGTNGKLVALLLIFGAAIRLWYFLAPLSKSMSITPDEAVYGLQALRILKGEPTVFYWAQPYTGTPSAFVSAFLFLIFGVSSIALKIVPFLCSLAFLYTSYLLAKKVFGSEKIGVIALFISALGTPFWNNWSSRAGSGYPEVCLAGNILLLLVISIIGEDKECGRGDYEGAIGSRGYKYFLLGLLIGFGFWVQPTIVYYAIPALLALGYRRVIEGKEGIRRGIGEIGAVVAGAVVGGAPVIYHNIANPSVTTQALVKVPWGEKDAFIGLVAKAFPIILGTRTSWSIEDFFAPLAVIIWLTFACALGFWVAGVTRGIRGKREGWEKTALVLGVFLTTIVVFCLSGSFSQLFLEPRYVYALYSVIPLILAYFIREVGIGRIGQMGIISLILVNFAVGVVKAPPASFVDSYKLDRLIVYLESKEIKYARTDGELAHRIMFLTGEKIIASVEEGGMMAQRYPKYNALVSKATTNKLAVVYRIGSKNASLLDDQADTLGFRKEVVDGKFVVYTQL